MKLVNFKIPEQMHVRLKSRSKIDGLTVSEHVRRSIDRYLNDLDEVDVVSKERADSRAIARLGGAR